MSEIVITSPNTMQEGHPAIGVHHSRFGYHPCNWATFNKIRTLRRVFMESMRLAKRWERWERKEPQNRRATIFGITTALPEPSLCLIFTEKFSLGLLRGRSREIITWDTGALNRIMADYQNARMPKLHPDDCKPLLMKTEYIEEMYQHCVAWLQKQDERRKRKLDAREAFMRAQSRLVFEIADQ